MHGLPGQRVPRLHAALDANALITGVLHHGESASIPWHRTDTLSRRRCTFEKKKVVHNLRKRPGYHQRTESKALVRISTPGDPSQVQLSISP